MAKKRKLSEQASAPTSSMTTRSKAKATSAAATNPSKSSITKSTKSSISTSATTTRKKAKLSHSTTDDELPITDDGPSAPQYKEYTDAFTVPLDDGAPDYLSAMPSEILSEILSYLVVHHDPERAVRLHKDRLDAERKAKMMAKVIKEEKDTADNIVVAGNTLDKMDRVLDTPADTVDQTANTVDQTATTLSDTTRTREQIDIIVRRHIAAFKRKEKKAADEENIIYTHRPKPSKISKDIPHVFLSLAAMSTRLRGEVESFCRRYLTKHRERYYFRPIGEIPQNTTRRSERLKGVPEVDQTVYRKVLVARLTSFCFNCHDLSVRVQHAALANGIVCCRKCETEMFGEQITLSRAMEKYDLRDWMLLPTRKPGPRAKKVDLPVINYGTIVIGKPYFNGIQISYRFAENDVKRVASAVHGDVEAHVKKKRGERRLRRLKRRDVEHRKLKARFHREMVDHEDRGPLTGKSRKYHQKRAEFYEDPNCDEGYPNSRKNGEYDVEGGQWTSRGPIMWNDPVGYGWDNDVHKRLCVLDYCDRCEEEKLQKYVPWWV